ncbi:hypothetical protein N9E56_03120 [Flavobacteriaceae bacterium]|nr:hypothetical protein [Flavobacteriaceae bacterium]
MKTISNYKYLFIAITFFLLQHQSKINAQGVFSKIDSLLQEKYEPSAPGAAFLISKDGNVIYKKAFGLANLELSVPRSRTNPFVW